MSRSSEIPYSVRLSMALLGGDRNGANKIVCEAFEGIAHELMATVNSYAVDDMPFVVATMLIVGNSVKNILPGDGKAFVDTLLSRTTTMAVNLEELRRQERGQNDGKQGEQ